MTRTIAHPTGDGDIETKVRYVRNANFWGLPYGTPIRPGMKPRGELAKRMEAEGKPVRDDVGVVEVKPKKDGSLRVKPKARGKRKLTPQQITDSVGSLMRVGLDGGDAEDAYHDDITDKDGAAAGELDLLVENGVTPAELDERLRGAEWDDGRVGDSADRADEIDRYIDDTVATYRQKYTAALVAQNDDGTDDVEPADDTAAPAGPTAEPGPEVTPSAANTPDSQGEPGPEAAPAAVAPEADKSTLSPMAQQVVDAVGGPSGKSKINRLVRASSDDSLPKPLGSAMSIAGLMIHPAYASVERADPRSAGRNRDSTNSGDDPAALDAVAEALTSLGLGDKGDRGDSYGGVSDYLKQVADGVRAWRGQNDDYPDEEDQGTPPSTPDIPSAPAAEIPETGSAPEDMAVGDGTPEDAKRNAALNKARAAFTYGEMHQVQVDEPALLAALTEGGVPDPQGASDLLVARRDTGTHEAALFAMFQTDAELDEEIATSEREIAAMEARDPATLNQYERQNSAILRLVPKLKIAGANREKRRRAGENLMPKPVKPAPASKPVAPSAPKRFGALTDAASVEAALMEVRNGGGSRGKAAANAIALIKAKRPSQILTFPDADPGVFALSPTVNTNGQYQVRAASGAILPVPPGGLRTPQDVETYVRALSMLRDAKGDPPPWDSSDTAWVKGWRNGEGEDLKNAFDQNVFPDLEDRSKPGRTPERPQGDVPPAPTEDRTAGAPESEDRVGVLPSGKKPSPKLQALLGQAVQTPEGWKVTGHENTIFRLVATDLATRSGDNRSVVLNERGARLMAPYLPSGDAPAADAPAADAPAADAPAADAPAADAPYVPTGNMNAPETMTPEQLDAEIAAAKELQAELRRRKVPSTSAQLADAKMRQKVFEDQKRINDRNSTAAAPSTPDVPEAPPAESTVDAPADPNAPEGTAPAVDEPTPDTLTLPDGRTLPRDELDAQEAEFLTDRWTLRDDNGRVQATVERDTDGDYTWSVIGEDGQARNGYGARNPQDAQDRLAEQLGALPADGEAPAEDFGPDSTISTEEVAQADGVSLDAAGLIEADDGELEVSEEIGARQDRVEELLTGTPDLTALDDGALGETRRDVVDELRLQEEIARRDRQRGTTAPDAGAAPAPAAEGDAVDTAPAETVAEVEPVGPKPRPGVAGAAEDLADALESGDETRAGDARTRLDSSLRRSRSDSPIVAELRTMLEGDAQVDPAALRDAAERLRTEAREKRNASARTRRLAKRLERERLRSLLGEIDAEMRTRNLDPDRFGGTAPRADGAPEAPAAPEPDDTIGAADVAQAAELGAGDDTIAPADVAAAQELSGGEPAPAATEPPAPVRTPRTFGELQPGDTYPSPQDGQPVTVSDVTPRPDGQMVEVSGSTANGGREWNLLPTAGPIPGAPAADEPVTVQAEDPTARPPEFAIPPAPDAPAAPPATTPAAPVGASRPLPDTTTNRIRQSRVGDKFTARTGGTDGGQALEFEILGEPVEGRGSAPSAVDARSNTLGEGRLVVGADWSGADSLYFIPDSDGRKVNLSPTSLERADGLTAPTTPEGSYRQDSGGASVVLGRNYIGGVRQVSPKRWVWSAELYGPDGKLIRGGGDKVDSPEAAQRAIRDVIEGGYLDSADFGNRIPEGETLPQIPERAAAPAPRSVSIPDAPPAFSGPVNAVTGRPDYTEPPELLPRAIPTPRAGWSAEEIRAGIEALGDRGAASADAIDWDSVIIAPGGGLMAHKLRRPAPGDTGYKIALTENGAAFTTGGMSLDKPTVVSMLNTLTRGVTPGGDRIDWGVSTASVPSTGGNGVRDELRRVFPDGEHGEGSAIKFALSKVIADKIAKNQASSPIVRNAKSIFGIFKPKQEEYPNATDAGRNILDNIGGLKLLLNDGKRERARYAVDNRTDAEIKDDGETIRVAQGADALFDLGAPDKAIALIERRIDELEQVYGVSGYDVTKGDASSRGSIMLRRVADAMRDAYDPEPVGMSALRAAEPGDRLMMASAGSATGRRMFRVKHNTSDSSRGKDRRILTVVEEGVAGGRDQRMSVTEQGMQEDDFGADKSFRNKNVVRLGPNEPAPEGPDAVKDRIGRRTPMPAFDDAIAVARANLDTAFGPITREQPTRAPAAAKRTKAGDADRSGVINRPGVAESVGMSPAVADRILQVQNDLVAVRTGADFTLLDESPRFGVHEKIGDVKGTWGEGNELNDDPEFWRTARLSAGGAFVTGKDGSIRHAETGALMSNSLADQATADRAASYLERLVDPETGQAYDWNDPAAVSRRIKTRSLQQAGAVDPENPTRAELAATSAFNPLIGVRKQAELDQLVAAGPGATRKATVPVQSQFDTGDHEGHRPSVSTAPYTALTGVEPGRKGDYPNPESTKNARKLDGIVNWARTLAPVRPYDTIVGLRAAAVVHRDDKIARNVRAKGNGYDSGPVVEVVRGTIGDVLDKMADELERDTDPEQWTEMQKLDRAGRSGDLRVTGAKVTAQELASGRGKAENDAYAQKIADAIKANGVRLEWVDQNTYRSAYGGAVPPHYRLTVPGVSGVGDYRDEATGDLVIEQIDQHNKGVQMDKDGNVVASWRTYNPDGPDYAETIMTLRFDNGQWTFVDKDAVDSADGPEMPAPQDLDA